MTDLITRIRHVEDTAQWIDSSTGEIVEAVKLSDLQAVPMDDLADCAHQLNEALDARDAAVAHVRELEAEVQHSHDERDALRAKLAEEEMVSESWRIRIAAAVGAVHEWDHGSAPGTWEQIEDKAESDRKQADATLDEMIVYRDKCETLESRLTRYAALESAAMKLCKSSTDAEWQALSAALDALSAPAPKPEQGETEPQSWPCRECVENKDGRCETAGMPVENERDEEYCPNFTRRMPETLVAVATEVGNG